MDEELKYRLFAIAMIIIGLAILLLIVVYMGQVTTPSPPPCNVFWNATAGCKGGI